MIVGSPSAFAIESEITQAYPEVSLRARGYFIIHVAGREYGVRAADATMLANSLDEVRRRVANRGRHLAVFASAEPNDIAEAVSVVRYSGNQGSDERFCGLTRAEFSEALYSGGLLWAPDGDEAFDDGSHVLQFDVDDRVRVIAFKREGAFIPGNSLRSAWLPAEQFYQTLERWSDRFESEWALLPRSSQM